MGLTTHIAILVLSLPLFYYFYTPWLLFPVFLTGFLLLGSALAFFKGSYQLRRVETQPRPPQSTIDPVLYRMKVYSPRTMLPTLISNNVDVHIQSVIDLVLKHHVGPLYSVVAPNHDQFFSSLHPEVWKVLQVLLKRVSQIDTIKLISHDSIELFRKHFYYFRGSRPSHPSPRQNFPDLRAFPYLQNSKSELEFLRKAVETLLCVCLEKGFLECTPVRVLIREFLVSRIVQPTIDKICEPDYINQKLLLYLTKQEVKTTQKRYAHSATYEAFMEHIEKCEDIDELTHIRQSIITDIMQTKAVQRLKENTSTGLRVTNLSVSVPAEKAKMLMERSDLKLYVTQLTTCKGVCERKIRKLGGEDYQQDHFEEEHTKPDYPRPIPFDTIMSNERALSHFESFVSESGSGDLVGFWRDSGRLGDDVSDDIHQQIKRVHSRYLKEGAEHPIYPQRELLSQLEDSLQKSSTKECLECLRSIRNSVYYELQGRHYESFLYSKSFKKFMEDEAESEDIATLLRFHDNLSSVNEGSIHEKRLQGLKRKLSDKDFALESLRSPSSTNSTAQVKRLEKVRTELNEEIKQLQRYIEHTEEWFGTVGKWNVEISNVDTTEDEGYDKDPLMILVVHRPELPERPSHDKDFSLLPNVTSSLSSTVSSTSETLEEQMDDHQMQDIDIISLSSDEQVPKSAGWVLGRRLSEFQELHQKISPVAGPNLSLPPLPRKAIFPFKKKDSEQKYWESYSAALQVYINHVIHDPKLIESEEVFNFLSPASADLRKEGKPSRLLAKEGKGEEPILDSISALTNEVFELQDRSIRRQLYDLAQLTFGRSIEGELQDLMKWLVSEPMLVYYVQTFQESMWPDGLPSEPVPDRSDEEKEQTREEAKEKFMNYAPQSLQTVLGQRNCQIGFLKIFAAFQDRNANKQLFYSFFELLLYALVPELEEIDVTS